MGGTRNKQDTEEVKGLIVTIHRLDEQNARLRGALESIGRNTCGREPLAAAYARGVLAEVERANVFPTDGLGDEEPVK
jgi:hypothetical protein